MKRSRLFIAIAALSLVPVTGASSQESKQCQPDGTAVRLRLSSESYERGEPVRMRLHATNTSDAACEMQFPSGRGGTVRVFEDGELVWEHGYCRVYTQHIELETWEPGHSETWGFRWRQHLNERDEKGRLRCGGGDWARAEPGRYEARAVFFGSDPHEKTRFVSFRIDR